MHFIHMYFIPMHYIPIYYSCIIYLYYLILLIPFASLFYKYIAHAMVLLFRFSIFIFENDYLSFGKRRVYKIMILLLRFIEVFLSK